LLKKNKSRRVSLTKASCGRHFTPPPHSTDEKKSHSADSFDTENGIFISQKHPHLLISRESLSFDYI